MLARIDKTLPEAELNENWWFEWEISSVRYEEYKKDSIKLLKKVFKCNRLRATETFEWFYSQFGIKIKKK